MNKDEFVERRDFVRGSFELHGITYTVTLWAYRGGPLRQRSGDWRVLEVGQRRPTVDALAVIWRPPVWAQVAYRLAVSNGCDATHQIGEIVREIEILDARLSPRLILLRAPLPSEVFLDPIMQACTSEWDIQMTDLFRHDRRLKVVEARHAFCYVARETTHLTIQAIGAYLQRDHGAVCNSINQAKAWRGNCPPFKARLTRVLAQFHAEARDNRQFAMATAA